MSSPNRSHFLDLLTRSFGSLPRDAVYDEFQHKLEEVQSEVEFDLFLWSLAHRFKVDTEELLRQLGERWALELAEREDLREEEMEGDTLQCLDWLVSRSEILRTAPIPGMDVFSPLVASRKADSLRVTCRGARRCCSFFEGVARGVAETNRERVRYLRQPRSSTLVEIVFSTFRSA